MTKTCIVGATGFLGRHVCEAFHNAGAQAIATSRAPDLAFLNERAPSIRAIAIDDPALWPEVATCDTLIHLGTASRPGTSWRAPEDEILTNVATTARLVRRTLDENPSCHVVFASSGGTVYGPDQSMPIKESAPTKPSTAYALGKILSEAVLDFFSSVDGAQVTTLRIANPIGRWQFGGRHGFVAAAVLAAVTGQELTIFGDGNNSRDYFDADDFAEFLLQLCLAPTKKAGVFNIGSGVARTELQVIEEVERMAQKTLRYNLLAKRPFDLRYAVLDCGSAEANLNWNPKTEFDASVAKMIDALRLASGN